MRRLLSTVVFLAIVLAPLPGQTASTDQANSAQAPETASLPGRRHGLFFHVGCGAALRVQKDALFAAAGAFEWQAFEAGVGYAFSENLRLSLQFSGLMALDSAFVDGIRYRGAEGLRLGLCTEFALPPLAELAGFQPRVSLSVRAGGGVSRYGDLDQYFFAPGAGIGARLGFSIPSTIFGFGVGLRADFDFRRDLALSFSTGLILDFTIEPFRHAIRAANVAAPTNGPSGERLP